jgi:catechol 2,3-dioxygenase-like lactoylglutathione lyase family enzyme
MRTPAIQQDVIVMFDHVTVRIPDLGAAIPRYQSLLDPLSMDQTVGTRAFAGFGDFLLSEPDDEHPLTRRAQITLAAPTAHAVEEFLAAGRAEGLREEDGVLIDEQDNRFAAVERPRRPANVDRVRLAVADLEASTAFYSRVAAIVGDIGELELTQAEPTVGLHLAFGGDDATIRRFYEELIAGGYRDFGAPGERARYHPGYYAAYVLDPDGNNIEVVDHHR